MRPTRSPLSHLSRRALLKSLGTAPLLFRPSPLHGTSWFEASSGQPKSAVPDFDIRYVPHYPARSPLEDVLRKVRPGTDEFVLEGPALEIDRMLERWGKSLRSGALHGLRTSIEPAAQFASFVPTQEARLRNHGAIQTFRSIFGTTFEAGADHLLANLEHSFGGSTRILTATFEITTIAALQENTVQTEVRYSLVAERAGDEREQRVGTWRMDWAQNAGSWKVRKWQPITEERGVVRGPGFQDVTEQAFQAVPSYREQLLRGSDEWRTVLDGACGIDVYGNNGVSVGDYNNDGCDDLYVSQPAGLPNRLYRNRGDGTFEDATDKAGVGVLDNTACALFADFHNTGLQDLLVVCGSGPLLFLNQGDGTFKPKRDAFQFARPPEGTFTGAAIADYDRDGRLDIYFCLYSYYLGLDQYHYPAPYFDARNGPPNFLFHNQGDGTFIDRTEAAGLNAENNRYSFACAWGETADTNHPDLYVVNDFGRNNLYRNNGDGTFRAVSTASHVEDVGAGMSAAWGDYNNDGKPDLYVANMWSAAGQRISQQLNFHPEAPETVRALYQRHARGNGLYRNRGDGTFENVTRSSGTEAGRWAWGSDFLDFDHDGYADLYVTNGYITAPEQATRTPDDERGIDLGSFFWRQVVAKSSNDGTPSLAYEHGWNALNELIRTDHSWSGNERNVAFANNHDGTFTEVSGPIGLDCLEDSRSFALADLDGDGRLELILKNRNAPQLRVFRNALQGIGSSMSIRLQGTRSNRDAIGAAVTLIVGDLRQTKYVQAGSGFLSQHTKELHFGIGYAQGTIKAVVRWPSSLIQHFDRLPANSCIQIAEGDSHLTAKPFSAPSRAYTTSAQKAPQIDATRDASVQTWLLDPLRAPAFSLPDLSGQSRTLDSLHGQPALLLFWSASSPSSIKQLSALQASRSEISAVGIKILALNVDGVENVAQTRTLAAQEGRAFPIILASPEIAGVYNIIFRYLFDRRADLELPAAFFLDRNGMMVKVYQGIFSVPALMQDAKSIPATAADRISKGLPFHGILHEAKFTRNDFTYGVAMFQHGYLDQAAASFQQVVAAHPNDAEGYYNLGTLNLRRNNYTDARQFLQQTLKLKPDYPEAWNNLAMVAAQQGQSDEAARNFQQALSLRPSYATAMLNLGNLYRRQHAYAKANEYLARAAQLQPDDPEIAYSLGMLAAQQNDIQAASQYLQHALTLRPDYPEALNNMGVLLVRQQEYTAAEKHFQTAIQQNATFEDAYMNLARLYVLQHQTAKAKQALQALQQAKPDSKLAIQALQALDAAH